MEIVLKKTIFDYASKCVATVISPNYEDLRLMAEGWNG